MVRGLTRESGHWGNFGEHLLNNFPNGSITYLDLPGAGKYNNIKSPTSISEMVVFLRSKIILDKNNINILVASSLGGMVAMDWLMRFQSDFDGIVTISSSFREVCSFNQRVKKDVWMDILKLLLTNNLKRREQILLKINCNSPQIRSNLLESWISIQEKRKMTKMNIFRQIIAGWKYSILNKEIKTPLLIVGSKSDRMVCRECIEKTFKLFGGNLVWHNHAGHSISLDNPEWLAIQIRLWLNQVYKQ